MPITVGNGTLDRYFARLSGGVIDAYVTYALSNGSVEEKAHVGIPLSAVLAEAAANSHTEWTPSDLCAVIAAGIPEYDGTITAAGAPTSPVEPAPAPPADAPTNDSAVPNDPAPTGP